MARPRSEDVDERILDAARAILEESGYDGLSMHAVARRARVGHPAIYRRYRDKNDLAMAVSVTGSVPADLPDTGSFSGDLVVVEEALIASLAVVPRGVIGPQLGTMVADRAVSEQLRGSLMDSADRMLEPLWARAVRRGEVDPDLDGRAALQSYSYAVIVNVLVMHRDPSGAWREQHRAVFLRGVAPAGGPR